METGIKISTFHFKLSSSAGICTNTKAGSETQITKALKASAEALENLGDRRSRQPISKQTKIKMKFGFNLVEFIFG